MIASDGGSRTGDEDIVLVANVRNTVVSGKMDSGDFLGILGVEDVAMSFTRLWTEGVPTANCSTVAGDDDLVVEECIFLWLASEVIVRRGVTFW